MRSGRLSILNVLCTAACSAALLSLAGCASAAGAPGNLSAEERAAVEVAMQTLSAGTPGAGVNARLQAIEPRQWPDSSLGCPQRGMNYMQVLTDGYVVKLKSGNHVHEVRVAGANGVICPLAASGEVRRAAPAHRMTNLDAMEKAAIADLAKHIGADPAQVRIARRIPRQWLDETLDCAAPERSSSAEATVAGFVLVLRHGDRFFNYHTDLTRVMACPPIDAQ